METLLQTYCFEIEVTCTQASEQDAFVERMALHLVQYLAVFLAETITGLLQRVLTHPCARLGGRYECSAAHTEVLGPGYNTELLCASSRHRAVREQEKQRPFFLLHAAKVRSSCEEGPGQSALQSAYHDPKLDVTELKQKTEHLKSFRPKIANKQINKNQLDRRRRWQKSVGSKLVQGEDRKERVANRELCR